MIDVQKTFVPKVGEEFFRWESECEQSECFRTIDEAIQDYQQSDSCNVYFVFPTFEHSVVDEIDDGEIVGTTSALSYMESAKYAAYGRDLVHRLKLLLELSDRNDYAKYRAAVKEIVEGALELVE